MEPVTNQILIALVVVIIGHAIAVIVKSPKEAIRDLMGEVSALRTSVVSLEKQTVRHDEVNKRLDASILELTRRIERLEPFAVGKAAHGRATRG